MPITTRTIVSFATLAILILPMSVQPAAAAGTFLAYWNGTPFLEDSDPLDRFNVFTVSDPDGDRVVPLTPMPTYTMPSPSVAGWATNTDQQILAGLQAMGWSLDDVIAQMDMVLGPNPANPSQRDQAFDLIQAGQINTALNIVQAYQDLQVQIHCGPDGNPTILNWFIGVPVYQSCANDGVTGYRLIAPEVTYVWFTTSLQVDAITVDVHIQNADPLSNDWALVGVGYKGHVGGIYAPNYRDFTAEVSLSGLSTNEVDGLVTFVCPLAFFEGERLLYTYGGPLSRGKTVNLNLTDPVTQIFSLHFIYTSHGEEDWDIMVEQTTASPAGFFLDIYLDFEDDPSEPEKVLVMQAYSVPNKVNFGYTNTETASGVKKHVRVGAVGNTLDTEIFGTYYEDGSPTVSFQMVGIPNQNLLVMDWGQEEDGILSFNILKPGSGVNGRYRTILVTGHIQGFAVDVTASDVGRGSLVMGAAGKDVWANDDDPFIISGMNFQTATGTFALRAKQNWYTQVHMDMSVTNFAVSPKVYHYDLGPLLTCNFACSGNPNEGALEWQNRANFNGHFWAISLAQLPISECARVQSGVCP